MQKQQKRKKGEGENATILMPSIMRCKGWEKCIQYKRGISLSRFPNTANMKIKGPYHLNHLNHLIHDHHLRKHPNIETKHPLKGSVPLDTCMKIHEYIFHSHHSTVCVAEKHWKRFVENRSRFAKNNHPCSPVHYM